MLINKIVIGVSGGPDSMYLLNKLYNDRKYEPIVVHVNYNFREEAKEEQQFVEEFCKERNIKIYSFSVKDSQWKKYEHLSNKQSMAREYRYDKYFEVAKKENTKHIFIAQHKDDFIETAIMQENKSGDDYLFYGIQQECRIDGFVITRPLLNMYKEEILKYMDSNNLEYRIDKSNFEPIYERNRIRIELSKLSWGEKETIWSKFNDINMKKEDLRYRTDIFYDKWVESDFDWEEFQFIHPDVKRHVVYKFLINSDTRINISSDKIDGIIEFLSNKRGDKNYRLMENVFLGVKNSKIIIYNK